MPVSRQEGQRLKVKPEINVSTSVKSKQESSKMSRRKSSIAGSEMSSIKGRPLKKKSTKLGIDKPPKMKKRTSKAIKDDDSNAEKNSIKQSKTKLSASFKK